MSPTPPPSRNCRTIGIRKGYPYYAWLKEALKCETDPLNYFSFAITFSDTEQKTNSHYSDLLRLLSDPKQSKRLLRLANNAKDTFQVKILVKIFLLYISNDFIKRVGHLGIIDFSSETVSSMLRNELDEEDLNEIIQNGKYCTVTKKHFTLS